LKEEGFNEFRKMWGDRENKDDWRRSSKIVFTEFKEDDENKEDTNLVAQVIDEAVDELTVEGLRKKLPLTDSLFEKSVVAEIEALYTSGVLFKELLNENELAMAQFQKILAKKRISNTDLSAAFQLYKLNENNGSGAKYKEYIIKNYPNSDVANYFKDPDFFVKQKEGRIAAQKDYVGLVERYEKKEYQAVYDASELIVGGDKSNALRAEYMLLNVLAAGQLTEDKKSLLPKLTRIIDEKPGTLQAIRAKEMIDIINNGISKNEPLPTPKPSMFVYNDAVTQFVMILMDEEEDVNDAKNDISDFTAKKYKNIKLKVQSKLTLKETSFVLVAEFASVKLASDYIVAYKAGYEDLDQWQNNRIQIITQENLKKLIESSNFELYKEFYDLNY
jgi:hypothetical protein